jgi:hypothetical protein
MISRIIFAIVLMAGLCAKAIPQDQECNYNIQGIDFFPWSTAPLPFPWSDIQGVWKLSTDSSLYIKAKVVSSTKNRKILNLELVTSEHCSTPLAWGTGFVDVSEKNVVRAILSDGSYRYQLKLGKFESKALKIDARVCGESILAATVKVIGSNPKISTVSITEPSEPTTQNMMLKKISSNLNAICKKPAAH